MSALTVGIGCRRGASAGQIEAAVRDALGAVAFACAFDTIRAVATLDTKAAEPGLVAFCARYGLPLHTFTREQIARVDDSLFSPSALVRERLGVAGVCEPCALLAEPAGRLLVGKRVFDGVTVAIACTVPTPHSNDTLPFKEDQ